MTNNEQTLAPCPWCGGSNLSNEAYSVQPDDYHGANVNCLDCEIEGPNGIGNDRGWSRNPEDAKVDAVTAWNTRAAQKVAEGLPEKPEYYSATRLKRDGIDAISSVSAPWTVVLAEQYDAHINARDAQIAELEAAVKGGVYMVQELEAQLAKGKEGLPERRVADDYPDRHGVVKAHAWNAYHDAVQPLVARLQGENDALRAKVTTKDKLVDDTLRRYQQASDTINFQTKHIEELEAERDELRAEVKQLKNSLVECHALLERAYRVAPPEFGRDIRAALNPPAKGSAS